MKLLFLLKHYSLFGLLTLTRAHFECESSQGDAWPNFTTGTYLTEAKSDEHLQSK